MYTTQVPRMKPTSSSDEKKAVALWHLAEESLSPEAHSDAEQAASLAAAQESGVTTLQYLQARLLLIAHVPMEPLEVFDQDE